MSPHRPARRLLRLVTVLVIGILACPARAELTDRVISVVDDVAITLSELAFEEALRAIDQSPVPPFRDGSRDALQLAEDVVILKSLAGDVRIFQPDPGEISDRMDALRLRAEAAGGSQ